MADEKNIFISHVHEDDALVADLKDLVRRAGLTVKNGSVTSDNPNDAKDEDYIKYRILTPRIDWASTLVVLIARDTATSWWVNWEIEHAARKGKRIVGVYARGASSADVPEALGRCGDAVIVGWQGDRVVDAIRGNLCDWDDPVTEQPRGREWVLQRHSCR